MCYPFATHAFTRSTQIIGNVISGCYYIVMYCKYNIGLGDGGKGHVIWSKGTCNFVLQIMGPCGLLAQIPFINTKHI